MKTAEEMVTYLYTREKTRELMEYFAILKNPYINSLSKKAFWNRIYELCEIDSTKVLKDNGDKK